MSHDIESLPAIKRLFDLLLVMNPAFIVYVAAAVSCFFLFLYSVFMFSFSLVEMLTHTHKRFLRLAAHHLAKSHPQHEEHRIGRTAAFLGPTSAHAAVHSLSRQLQLGLGPGHSFRHVCFFCHLCQLGQPSCSASQHPRPFIRSLPDDARTERVHDHGHRANSTTDS